MYNAWKRHNAYSPRETTMAKSKSEQVASVAETYTHEDKYIGGKLVEDDKPDEVMPLDAGMCRQMAKTLRAYAEFKGLELPNVYANAAQILDGLAEETEA
jgi:hypothetical protein